MTGDPQAMISETHRIYCALTGTTPNLRIWERDLYEYVQAGFTPKDMEEVVIWILRENKKASEPRYRKSLAPIKLFADLRLFDSYVTEARAENRNHKPPSAKERALRDLRPQMVEPMGNGHARHISELLRVPPPAPN